MNLCPQDNEPMVAFELEGIEIDHCMACGGTWLDAGELEMIAELADVGSGRLREALEKAAVAGKKSRRRCPRCRRRLREITIPGKQRPIRIDRCSRGDGLFFDPGEIEEVILSFVEGEEGAVARFFSDLFGYEKEAGSGGEEK